MDVRELTLDELKFVAGGRQVSRPMYDSTEDPDGSEIWGYLDANDRLQAQLDAERWNMRIDWNDDGVVDERGRITEGGVLVGESGRFTQSFDMPDGRHVGHFSWSHNDPMDNADSPLRQLLNNLDNWNLGSAAGGAIDPNVWGNFVDHMAREGLNFTADYYRNLLWTTPPIDAVPAPGSTPNPPADPYNIPQYPLSDEQQP